MRVVSDEVNVELLVAAQYVTVMTPPLLLLVLVCWVVTSVVCLSIEHLPAQQQSEEVQEDTAQLISIAEHLRKEHLGISNFNPSVRDFMVIVQDRRIFLVL